LNAPTSGSIVIERNNTIFNGNDFMLQGSGNDAGLSLQNVNNATIENTTIAGFETGISFEYVTQSAILENRISNNTAGIYFYSSPANIVSGNSIESNIDGIQLEFYSNNNNFTENNLLSNERGIHFSYSILPFGPTSGNNRFFHNNFISNIMQIYDDAYGKPPHWAIYASNYWDNGYPSGGNYWSDYDGSDIYSGVHQNETGFDWIGDTPYVIYDIYYDSTYNIHISNYDNYPLIMPFRLETEETDAYMLMAYRSLLQRNAQMRSYIDALNSEYQALSNEYNQLLSQFGNLNSTNNQLQSNYVQLLETYYALNASYQEHLVDYSKLRGNFTSLQSNNSDLQTDFNNLNASYHSLESHSASLQANVTKLSQDCADILDNYSNLNTNLNDYKHTTQGQLAYLQEVFWASLVIIVILTVTTILRTTRRKRQTQKQNS
jgi:parallel beta-helix repeat protein